METQTITDYIQKGRILIAEIKDHQMKIASYALKVCDIRHGGRVPDDVYTIKKYAQDIGMNPATLSNWITVYRDVVLKLTPQQQKSCDYKKASKLHDNFKQQMHIDNKMNNIIGKRSHYKRKLSPPLVQEKYEEMFSEKPFIGEFYSAIKSVKHVKFLLETRDLGIITQQNLIVLMQELDTSSDLLNDYLTEKQNKSTRKSA